METEEIKLTSRNLVQKLLEKFDRLKIKGYPVSCAISIFLEPHEIYISSNSISVYEIGSESPILHYCPTSEENDAYNLALLYSKIMSKFKKEKEANIQKIFSELDNL